MQIVASVYSATRQFPKEESFGLTSQIRRCSISIPSNIAEGFGRNSDVEFNRFLVIAIGSLYELQTQLEISLNIGYLDQQSFNRLYDDTRQLEAILSAFTKKIKERINSKARS
jgi:four helix bundle protein